VALLELGRGRLHTYDSAGRLQQVTPVSPGTGRPRLSRGQDGRLYVDGDQGRHVLVVDDDGRPATVPLTGAGSPGPAGAPGTAPTRTPRGNPPTSPSGPGMPQTSSPPARAGGTRPPAVAPDAVPAGPPGMPPRLAAAPRTSDLLVTWGAAAANGAAVTAYRVSWTAGGGRSGSVVRPGGARSAALTGLTRGVSYRITVIAENAAGRSAPARVDATLPRVPTVTVSRGATTTYETSCEPPECAFIRVELRGFEPNTRYEIDPYSSEWNAFNPGAELSTDDEGNLTVEDRFPFNGVDQTVWVVVAGRYQSNRYLWTVP
jgi:hypothetical protein